MIDHLDQKSDEQLDELFVVEVLRQNISRETGEPMMSLPSRTPGFDAWGAIPPFSRVADAVLPWLEIMFREVQWNPSGRMQCWPKNGPGPRVADAGTFARAAVMVLIRHARLTA